MTRFTFVAALVVMLLPAAAAAQVPGPSGLPGGAGTPTGEDEDKGDGVAEEAPKTPGLLPTTPTLPPPKGKRNKFELFELDGYFRLRSDYMKNFHLSFRDDAALGGAPFPLPIGCTPAGEMTPGAVAGRPCKDTLRSSNLRLRLEPRINVTETVTVLSQIDVLDNIVLGSDGENPQPDQSGVDSFNDTIAVRRAWAEVQTPLGIVTFGRQPWHWGMGMYRNSGAEDPINGGYDLDGDFGDTVDRVSFGTLIPGTRLRGGLAMDFPFSGLSSDETPEYAFRGGQPWDLDNADDQRRFVLTISRMDAPVDFSDAVDRGGMVLNWGIQFAYATQGWDYTPETAGEPVDPDAFVPRDMTLYTPNVWLKAALGALLLEVEAAANVGSIQHLDDQDVDDDASVRSFGGVARLTARAVENKLRFGVEAGGATGDDWDNVVEGRTHLSNIVPIAPGDTTLSRFIFNPDYKVDLIFFRELMGAVSNAFYAKPFMSYELTKSIDLKVANVTSFAHKMVSTPGNALMYGTEFDADLGFTSGAFHAGMAYGVFFPLSAMNHPADELGGSGFTYDDVPDAETFPNVGDAGNAHTFQLRLVVKF